MLEEKKSKILAGAQVFHCVICDFAIFFKMCKYGWTFRKQIQALKIQNLSILTIAVKLISNLKFIVGFYISYCNVRCTIAFQKLCFLL